jgi:uncharacterized membrane protein
MSGESRTLTGLAPGNRAYYSQDRVSQPVQQLVPIGRRFYSIALIAFGLQHLAHGDFVTRVVLSWPGWIPGPPLAAYVIGVVLIGAGISILSSWQRPEIALATGVLLLLSFAFLSLPRAVMDCHWCGQWTSAGKTLALSGGAFLVGATLPRPARGPAWAWVAGRVLFAQFLLLAGIQHFIWAGGVSGLVPAWIPHHLFWTYFAGSALAAGAVGILVPKTIRIAGALTGLMIFSWVFLVHLPLAVKFGGTQNGNQITAMFEALAFSGMAFMIAGFEPNSPGRGR